MPNASAKIANASWRAQIANPRAGTAHALSFQGTAVLRHP